MVLIHVKKGEDLNLYVEHDSELDIETVSRETIDVYNMVLRAKRLKSACDDLIQYGPMKPPEKQMCLDDEEGSAADIEAMCKSNPHFDPTGKRTGEAPVEQMADVIRRTVSELEASVGKQQFENKVVLCKEMIQDNFDKVRGALMIVWPMGLPDWEPAKLIVEEDEDLSGTQASLDVQDPETSVLWWASKQLQREGKTLKDYVGRNNKTKIVVQITKQGQGAPTRQAQQQSKSEQEAMMKHYFHKKEEWKQMEDDEDDSYLTSAWANPKGMKNSLNGVGNVSWRPR
eukprot:TRINITY_DN1548_c0_g1_i1.p1 TRINITY_DN1548_c0_g1~~TRINITY_DN1548_c0_g1_i1.p1  ORF type:complete len:286 (+),score=88.58 TRINITY_DN1548_c0_g1_i1:139-996(+)